MYIPKRYGESKVDKCPFCGRQATTLNTQKVPVCLDHKTQLLDDLKCACGNYLIMMTGKYGVFFNCIKCGNINMRKALEINAQDIHRPIARPSPNKNETTAKVSPHPQRKPMEVVSSDDPRYFD